MEGVHWEMKGLKLGQQSVAALHDGGRTLNVVKSSQGEVEQPASFLTRSSQSELGTNDTSRPRFGQSEIDSRSSRSEWDFLGLQTPPAQTARNRSYSARATPGGQSIVFLPNTEEILRRRYFNAPVTPGPCGKARGGIANVDAAFGLAPLGEDVREPLDNFMRPEGAKIINFKQAKKLARKAKDKEETVLAELEVDIDQSLDGVCGSATRKLFKKTSAKKVVKSTFPPIKAPMLSFEEKRALRSFASSSSFSSRAGSSFGDRNRSFTDFQMGGIVREATGAISLPVDDVEMTGVADLDQDEVATERAPSPSPATSFQVSIEGASNRKRFKPQAALSTDVKIRRGRHNGQGDRGAVPGFDNIVQDTEEQQAQDMQLADSVEPVPSSPAPAQPRTRFGGVRLLSSISTSKSQSKSTSPHRASKLQPFLSSHKITN